MLGGYLVPPRVARQVRAVSMAWRVILLLLGGFAFGAVGSWELSMVEHPCRVVVEGWRRLPHSYSIVATYFYHHLGQSLPAHCEILFYDVPYWNPNWEPITNRYLYDKLVESSMANMKSCNLTTWRNVTVRIAFPYNVNSREEHCQSNNEDHAKGKVLVIGTAEFMSVNDSIYWANAANNNLPAVLESINQQYNNNIIMVTHSSWSRAGFINAGISPRKIRNVPLGVDHNVYYGLSKREKVKWRVEILNRDDPESSAHPYSREGRVNTPGEMIAVGGDAHIDVKSILRLKSSEKTVFLSVGAMTRNKGMDVLLSAFGRLIREKPECCLLLLKGLDTLYSSVNYLRDVVRSNDLPENSIKYVGGVYSSEEMNVLYNIADLYVSPYRAEGFNMPVLEAMSVGLPIIVSGGGSTDDFVPYFRFGNFQPFIRTTLVHAPRNLSLIGDGTSKMLEPSASHLKELMEEFIAHKEEIQGIASGVNRRVAQRFSWEHFTEALVELFF